MQIVRADHLDRLEAEVYKPISEMQDRAEDIDDFCTRAKDKVMRHTMSLCRFKGGVCRMSVSTSAINWVWSELATLASAVAEIDKTPCDHGPVFHPNG
jgi:hypothetical protein